MSFSIPNRVISYPRITVDTKNECSTEHSLQKSSPLARVYVHVNKHVYYLVDFG